MNPTSSIVQSEAYMTAWPLDTTNCCASTAVFNCGDHPREEDPSEGLTDRQCTAVLTAEDMML